MKDGLKFQSCHFQPNSARDPVRPGIAKVKSFGLANVEWIIDAETGKLHTDVWSYRLVEGPCCYMGFSIVID